MSEKQWFYLVDDDGTVLVNGMFENEDEALSTMLQFQHLGHFAERQRKIDKGEDVPALRLEGRPLKIEHDEWTPADMDRAQDALSVELKREAQDPQKPASLEEIAISVPLVPDETGNGYAMRDGPQKPRQPKNPDDPKIEVIPDVLVTDADGGVQR